MRSEYFQVFQQLARSVLTRPVSVLPARVPCLPIAGAAPSARRGRLGLLALVLVGLLFFFLVQSAPAQESEATLVKNTGQDQGTGWTLNADTPERAQAFTTGSNTSGYRLASIGISFHYIADTSTAGSELTVTVNSDSSGNPGSALCTLTDPSSFSGSGLHRFGAPSGDTCPVLAARTTYFVVVKRANDNEDTINIYYGISNSEDALTPATGWTIGDKRHEKSSSGWTSTADQPHQIEVRGEAVSQLAHCDGTEIWCETLTVGLIDEESYTLWGWNDGGAYPGSALTGEGFQFEGRSYNLRSISLQGSSQRRLTLWFDSGQTGNIADRATRNRLMFHAGDTAFNMGTAELFPNRRGIDWSRTDLGWSDGDEVGLKILENHPATGSPAVSGTLRAGQTLTADTSGIADEDGIESYRYRWIRVDGSQEIVVGSNSSNYTLVAADEGKNIKVRVNITDGVGNRESFTSPAVGPVTGPAHCGGTEIWCGTLTVGQRSSGGNTLLGWNDGGNYTGASLSNEEFEFESETYNLDSVYLQGGMLTLGVDADNAGDFAARATRHKLVLHLGTATFNLATGALGSDQRSVTWSGSGLSWSSGDKVAFHMVENDPATGEVAIARRAWVGVTLTADTSGIADTDGLGAFSYQWMRVDDDAETNVGTDASTYTPVDEDKGKTIKVTVSFTDEGGSPESVTSSATQPVRELPPHCVGTEIWCETLTVGEFTAGYNFTYFGWNDFGTYTDAVLPSEEFQFDGKAYNLDTIRVDGGTLILGFDSEAKGDLSERATRRRLVFNADSGKFNLGTGSLLNENSWVSWRNSGVSWAKGDSVALAIIENHPATGSPSITGQAQVGATLTADTSAVTDEEGLGTFQYQWVRVDGGTESNVGADASTYTPVAADEGKSIRVRVSFTDAGGSPESATSEATDPVKLGGV